MRIIKSLYLGLLILFITSCEQYLVEEQVSQLQTITISADMGSGSRAGVSDAGAFTWHADDAISVLATDGFYYTMNLTTGAGSKLAKFTGSLPTGVSITTVAIYPATVANGTAANIYNDGTLTYTLPSEYTYKDGYAKVPMVSTFEAGATALSFKHIGALVRIPLNGMPLTSKIQVAAKNRKIAGDFTMSTDKVGTPEGAIETQTIEGNDVVTINYAGERAGGVAEINVPLPVGVYEDLIVSVKDGENNEVFTKTWSLKDKEFKRANLLVMQPEQVGPMAIVDVYPYFVDARVLWSKAKGADAYAIYVDGSSEPTIVAVDNLTEENGVYNCSFGGDFKHGSTHTVAVAPVIKGEVVADSKSEVVEFKTADIRQLTNNTGTKFVAVGWDDVTIANAPVWDPVYQRYSAVEFKGNQDKRGYRVQLLASDKTTVIYDLMPFDSHLWFEGAFCSDNNFGKMDGNGIASPTALTFCWLEPGTDYYFRVKALDETVYLDNTNGNYNPDGTADVTKPVPYPLCSERGGCDWSELVKLSTDPAHVPSENEILYEGFDDILVHEDIMNWSHVVVPDFTEEYKAMSKADYHATLKSGYEKFFKSNSKYTYRFYVQQWMTDHKATLYGMYDEEYQSGKITPLNEKIGLKGWGTTSSRNKAADCLQTAVGVAKLGRGRTYKDAVLLYTPAINTDKLSSDYGTKCIVTVNVSNCTTKSPTDMIKSLKVQVMRGLQLVDVATADFSQSNPDLWERSYSYIDLNNFTYWNNFYEVQLELYLRKGDQLVFSRGVASELGFLVIGDIKVEVCPGEFDDEYVERNWGTAPDNTNYDVWGLNGEMPVTFWMGPPVLDQFNAKTLSDAELATIKSTYFDPIVQGGYNLIEVCNPYSESMKVLLQWCQDAGVKMLDKSIGAFDDPQGNVARISQYANDQAYAGLFVGRDEPGYIHFDLIAAMNNAFMSALSTKARTVNLFPSYASVVQLNFTNSTLDDGNRYVTDFVGYVESFINKMNVTDRKFNLMFDHYCLEKSYSNGGVARGSVKSKQYYDLDVIRHYSLDKRIPFLQITHGRPAWDAGYGSSATATAPTIEKPTEHVYDEQRWLVWSQLALGSKGVSYFCYWTPNGFTGGPFSWTTDGTKTRMYDILKNINTEILPIGRILMKCHADGAITTNPAGNFGLYENEGFGLNNYGPVLGLARGNDEDVVAGCFRDASTGEYKVLVTHKAPATNDAQAETASIAKLTLDTTMVTSVKLHTVTLSDHNSAATTVESTVDVSGGTLTLNIPDGTAVLVEFPETAGQSYN